MGQLCYCVSVRQAATWLLHTIGTPGLKIYNSFEFSDDARNLEVILQKFNDYAIGELNETYERYKFNKRCQKDGENFETYLASLRL